MLTAPAVKAAALEFGFDLCGIARAVRHPRLARLAEWVADGRAGEMAYLTASLEERLDPARVLPGVRSVISLGVLYNTPAPYSTEIDSEGRAVIARYAWGEDYHDVVRERLGRLLRWMAATAGPGLEAFSCVDNGPVQERVFAEQAGLGWIGKNTCLINPKLGSWIFLAEILINHDLDPDSAGHDQCGSCTRCIEACPTGALDAPYALDARRCLSYLTIELRGAVSVDLRDAIRHEIFGCDICQDVCPWNRRAATGDAGIWQTKAALVYPRLVDLCVLSDEAWRNLIRRSAMRRAGLWRIRRSLAYAAAGLPVEARAEALAALATHPSGDRAEVREARAWAERSPV